MEANQPDPVPGYAMTIADASYEWYKGHAIRSRRRYRGAELTVLVASAAIPVSVAIWPNLTTITAVLGGTVAIISGLESIFHWRDNYLRYSQAREAVEAERRRYNTSSGSYSDVDTRDEALVLEITKIEQEEMGSWLNVSRSHSIN